MRKILVFLAFATLVSHATAAAGRAPLHEVRAVWLTTVGGLDWPHTYAHTPATMRRQQAELCALLDRLVAANINTVLLQARLRATTIYASPYEPWDGCLSGTPGTGPGYDALAYAVQECHRRGLQIHAWVVAIPAGRPWALGAKRLRSTHPELLRSTKDEVWLDPAATGTATYVADICRDIAERYDVDGIHLDYIRYPDVIRQRVVDGAAARENITRVVRAVHKAVKAVRPDIVLSCSPVGKYADTQRQWSHGWNARDAVFQDAAAWVRDGLMDALFPMMYFRGQDFYPFAVDWQERSAGATIAPGLGIYFMSPKEKDWPLADITRELHVTRTIGEGNAMFRTQFFIDDTKGIYSYYRDHFAPYPALPRYNVPTRRRTYNLYGSDRWPVDTTDGRNLLAAALPNDSLMPQPFGSIRYFKYTCGDPSSAHTGHVVSGDAPPSAHAGHVAPSPRAPLTCALAEGGKSPACAVGGTSPATLLRTLPAEAGALIVIQSITGVDIRSVIAAADGSVNTTGLPCGHYRLYELTRRGFRHSLGRIYVP